MTTDDAPRPVTVEMPRQPLLLAEGSCTVRLLYDNSCNHEYFIQVVSRGSIVDAHVVCKFEAVELHRSLPTKVREMP